MPEGREAPQAEPEPADTADRAGMALDVEESRSENRQQTASVPTMMTNEMRRQLRALGHTDDEIRKLRPQQAWDRIRAGQEAGENSINEAVGQNTDIGAEVTSDEAESDGTTSNRQAPTTRVPVDQIQVDPAEYQFRTEVNEQGVDSRLEGVEHWDDMRAGNLVLHEREDGRLFAADGHHRIDLARRTKQPDVNARSCVRRMVIAC